MTFTETDLPGAFLIELDRKQDERGHFARWFCVNEFAAHGLDTRVTQSSVSFNRRAGTLRGLHWQEAPRAEAKLVRCTRGAIYDVIVDLRPDSPARFRHIGVELTPDNGRMVYIPEGMAHGFQTLTDDTEVCYQISEFFAPELARGARWNDPRFGISWPLSHPIMNERDQAWPDFAG